MKTGKQLGEEKIKSRKDNLGFLSGGLNKREYFAGLMMQALIANPERYKYISEKVVSGMPQNEASEKNAHKDILLADALLEELCK